ncbi:unnamed protein product [Coregonus sp. 'balchen']|nr:unnamed protein product [Coregonus sp. 'balchen']
MWNHNTHPNHHNNNSSWNHYSYTHYYNLNIDSSTYNKTTTQHLSPTTTPTTTPTSTSTGRQLNVEQNNTLDFRSLSLAKT